MSGPAEIELIGVDVSHEDDPEIVLMHDVHWRIETGEWWVVSGGPASGKTSLLSTVAGLIPAVGGELRIFGRDVVEATEQEQIEWRRHIGFVFEGGGRLFGNLSVLENVLLPLQYHGDLSPSEARERAEELLALAGLRAYARPASEPPRDRAPAPRRTRARALGPRSVCSSSTTPWRGSHPAMRAGGSSSCPT